MGALCNDYANVISLEEIGRGGYGKVYLYTLPSGSQLAIKREKKVSLYHVVDVLCLCTYLI